MVLIVLSVTVAVARLYQAPTPTLRRAPPFDVCALPTAGHAAQQVPPLDYDIPIGITIPTYYCASLLVALAKHTEQQ